MLIGLVGKPSCGKSTFFKASTLADVSIAPYPFTTIKPNRGIAYVRVKALCKELGVVCNPRTGYCLGDYRFVPIELMDVAGLVEGASEGRGLGNQFLDDLRQADLFIQIVDISGTTDIEGRQGQGDPIEDVKMLEKELDLWYYGILKKVWDRFSRGVQQTKEEIDKAIVKQFSGLKVREEHVKSVIKKLNLDSENIIKWSDEDVFKFASELRKISKPMIIAANKIDKDSSKQNLIRLKNAFPDKIILPCSADYELSLKQAAFHGLIDYIPGDSDFKIHLDKVNEKQKNALELIKNKFLKEYGSTGVQEILDKSVFDLLGYIAVFPAGSKLMDSSGRVLPDCFLMPPGSTALDFAYTIHSDIGDKFVKAIDLRTKKALGKEYILKNRDAIEIVTT